MTAMTRQKLIHHLVETSTGHTDSLAGAVDCLCSAIAVIWICSDPDGGEGLDDTVMANEFSRNLKAIIAELRERVAGDPRVAGEPRRMQ